MTKKIAVFGGIGACLVAVTTTAMAQSSGASASASLSASGANANAGAAATASDSNEPPYLERYLPQAGAVEIGVFGGALLPSKDHNLHNEALPHQAYATLIPEFGLRLGYYPASFLGFEGEGMLGLGKTKSGSSATLYGGRLHLIAQLPNWSIVPFVLVGANILGVTGDESGDDLDPLFHFGVGAKAALSRSWGVRLDLRDNMGAKNGSDKGVPTHHLEGLLSLALTLGGSEEPVAALDSDGDGLDDAQDQCPKEPAQTADGCPVRDADGDGVLDTADKCPTEPAKTADGCPVRDADGDGVLDAADKCPTEPARMPDGCPIRDVDSDGIMPPDDKCPEQPETKNGFEDADGCPDELPDSVKAFTGVIQGIEFDTGKATVRPASKSVLDGAVAVLKEFPSLRLQVSGHTDNVGSAERNQTLSQERADAVRQYMVDAGIDAARIESVGAGSSQPLADNKKAEGRQKNRRIEFKVLQ